jgi:hypothetical protein
MYVQALAMAYNATQSTTDVGQAAMAAKRWKEKILKALTYEADLLKSVTMAMGYDPDELAAIDKLELEVLIDIQQREAEKAWTKAFAELELMPPTYEELTKESDAVLQEYDAMLA